MQGVIPVVGPLLGEGVKATTQHLLDLHQPRSEPSAAVKFNDPLETLTQVFLSELNHLGAAKVTLPSTRTRRERRILLFFDTFEQVANEVVPWLLYSMFPLEINPNIVFIIAGRDPLERATESGPKPWLPYYESHTLHALPVQLFTQEETTAYLAERGITGSERIETIWQLSHGLPLYLGLLTTNTETTLDPTKDVVDNFLSRIPESEQTKRQLALDASLFSKPFNLDDLEAFRYLSDEARPTLYAWLLRQPFIRASSLGGRYLYHELAQELFQRYLFQYSPKTYSASRRALVTYYQQQLEHLQMVQEKNRYGPSDERLEIMLALAFQCFFLPDEESHLQALSPLSDIWDYETVGQIDTMLRMLRKTVQILTDTQAGSHAHHVAQALFHFFETIPSMWYQTRKQEWLDARNQLLGLFEHTSSLELLAHIHDLCGWGYLRYNESQNGLLCFERALQFHPHSARIQNSKGWIHFYRKEYQQALDHFNRALDLAPHHPHPHEGRGRTYGRLGSYQQALRDLNRSIEIDWKSANPYDSRARVYLEFKEYRKALADWDHWLEVAPEDPQAARVHFQRGCTHLWLKDLTQATICFTRSYELASTQDFFSWAQDSVLWVREWSLMCQTLSGPHTLHHLESIRGDRYAAYVSKGVIFFLQKEFQQALTALQHATTLHRSDYGHAYLNPWVDFWREWDAHFWLAMVYIALDQEAEARKAIEQALAFEMPPILLKPLSWFERERSELYEKFIKSLLDSYGV